MPSGPQVIYVFKLHWFNIDLLYFTIFYNIFLKNELDITNTKVNKGVWRFFFLRKTPPIPPPYCNRALNLRSIILNHSRTKKQTTLPTPYIFSILDPQIWINKHYFYISGGIQLYIGSKTLLFFYQQSIDTSIIN